MPDLVYPYLVEGAVFNAFSLNSRFGATGAPGFGVNAVMPYAAKRGAFQEEHLPTTGIVAGEAFSDLTVKIDPASDQFVDHKYIYGAAVTPPYPVLSDGVQNLEVLLPGGIDLAAGMAGAQKVGGVLILANVHFMLARTVTPLVKDGPLGFMVAAQILDGNTGDWEQVVFSERFSNERIIATQTTGGSGFAAGTPLGDGPFDRPRSGGNYDESDDWTYQDIPIRLWLDSDVLTAEGLDGSNIQGFRVVGAVVDLGTPGQPIGYQPAIPLTGSAQAYYREANLSVIPFHAEIMP